MFTYDANGNTLTKTIDGFVSTYTYGAKNHMAGGLLNDAGVITSTTYRYDVDGIRIGKTEGVDTTDYLIDPNRDYAQVVRETDGAGVSIDYLYGDDLIQQSQAASNERYYLYDGLGSTRLLTDGVGAITDTYDYEAFGSVLNQTGVTENDYRFTGEQYDGALDNYYLRARYYDQNTARFTQMDTWMGNIGDPLSLHKYIYTESDPINNIDPSGNFLLFSQKAAGTIRGILTKSTTNQISALVNLIGIGVVVGAAQNTRECQNAGLRALVSIPLPSEKSKDCGLNRVRVQFQISPSSGGITIATWADVAEAPPQRGVSVSQVEALMRQLFYTLPAQWPNSVESDIIGLMARQSIRIRKIPPVGVPSGWTNKEAFTSKRFEYRIDVESLRGANLMRLY